MIRNPGPGITRLQILQKAGSNFSKLNAHEWGLLYLRETKNDHAPIDDLSAERLKVIFSSFQKRVLEKYRKNHRILTRLYADPWLKEEIQITISFIDPPNRNRGKGAPRKNFTDLAHDSQRRVLKNVTAGKCLNQLISAVEYKARMSKKNDLSFIMKMLKKDNTLATKLRKLLTEKKATPDNYSPKEAVALILENSLSKKTYQALRQGARDKNHGDLYPPYNACREEKKKTYPDSVEIGEYHKQGL